MNPLHPLQYTYGKCKYNLDIICQCQEYTLNYDKQNECLLCKHNKGWHEKLPNNPPSYSIKSYPTSDSYKPDKV